MEERRFCGRIYMPLLWDDQLDQEWPLFRGCCSSGGFGEGIHRRATIVTMACATRPFIRKSRAFPITSLKESLSFFGTTAMPHT